MDLVSGYLVLEEVADNRTYNTWQERVQAAVTRVGLELRYLVSDRAKALIKLALKGLGCPSVPDLFHALRDLAKVMGVSLALKLAQVEEKLTHAQQQLSVLEAKGHDTHVQQRLLTHLSAQAEVLRADQATYQSTLQQASQAVHPFTLAESQAQSSAQVESQLQQAVATIEYPLKPGQRRVRSTHHMPRVFMVRETHPTTELSRLKWVATSSPGRCGSWPILIAS